MSFFREIVKAAPQSQWVDHGEDYFGVPDELACKLDRRLMEMGARKLRREGFDGARVEHWREYWLPGGEQVLAWRLSCGRGIAFQDGAGIVV